MVSSSSPRMTESRKLPNILLTGTPGTGKVSLRLKVEKLNFADLNRQLTLLNCMSNW